MDGGGRAMQDDSMDGIGRVASGTKTEQLPRTKPGARVENRSVYVNHEDSSTEVIYRMYCMPILQEQKSVTQPSRKKCIFRGAHN